MAEQRNSNASNNWISKYVANEIADVLINNMTLTNINLSYNQISDDGVSYIANALINNYNKTLTSIDLSHNEISNDGAKEMANALKSNETLTSIDLSHNKISDDGAKEIANALKNNKTLTSIDLSHNKISNYGTKEIAYTLKNNVALTSIDLSHNKISNSGIIYIANALKVNRTLTSINLSHNGISKYVAIEIANALRNNKTLTSIDLSHNKISEDGVKKIVNALKNNETLTSIDLSHTEISEDGAKEIANALKNNVTLTSINLSHNEISEDGAKEIANALDNNKTLTSIDLSHNKISTYYIYITSALASINLSHNEISEDGAKEIANALKNNVTLTSIDLSHTKISGDIDLNHNEIPNLGIIYIADALKNNVTLTSINLSHNEISNSGIIYIAYALKNNVTLTSIDLSHNEISNPRIIYETPALASINLSHNKISDDGAKDIANALKNNKTLTNINLSHNEISDDGVKKIVNALKNITSKGIDLMAFGLEYNMTLTSIDLSHNKISDDGAKEIANALKHNMTLTSIDLSHNKISEDGAKEIANALIKNKTLTSIDLRYNKIPEYGTKEIVNVLINDETSTSIDLWFNTLFIKRCVRMFNSQCNLSSSYFGKRVQAWAAVVWTVYKIVKDSSDESIWSDILKIDLSEPLKPFCAKYHGNEPKKLACAIYMTRTTHWTYHNDSLIDTCHYLCKVLGAIAKYSENRSLEIIGYEIALHLSKYLGQDLLNGEAIAKISDEEIKKICNKVKGQNISDFRPINEACKMAGLPLIQNNLLGKVDLDMPRLWDVENDCFVNRYDKEYPSKFDQIGFVSHVWEEKEVTYETLRGRSVNISKDNTKLEELREELRQIGRYWWMDTICINKSDLAELDMSIRSMYRWYQAANVVVIPQTTSIRRWASRGWCLQEGLAARWLLHDDKDDWFTNAGLDFGFGFEYNNANSYKLLRLMESRKTTRREDMAYCLIGIFQLDFPIMYGEGYRAQERLLEALCQQYGDLSWLYWRGEGSKRKGRSLLPGQGNIYDCFSLPKDFNQMNNNCTVNHLGLELTCHLLFGDSQILSRLKHLLINEVEKTYLPFDGWGQIIKMIESQSDHLAVCFISEISGASLVEVTDIPNVFRHIITLHWQDEIPAAAEMTKLTIG